MTGDDSATEASLWLAPGYTPEQIEPALRAATPFRDFLEIRSAGEVRMLSLRAFDRAFAITYALEAVAVIIGLLGIAFAASSAALARRAEFGMLRHVGLRRRDVLAMLAAEGLATSAIGVVYGLVVGVGLSSILVFVVNRQSFNWSVDLAMPWLQLGVVSTALLIAAALTATIAGRAALSTDAVRAVREDW
jgi:putative ABC transport system permease protein